MGAGVTAFDQIGQLGNWIDLSLSISWKKKIP